MLSRGLDGGWPWRWRAKCAQVCVQICHRVGRWCRVLLQSVLQLADNWPGALVLGKYALDALVLARVLAAIAEYVLSIRSVATAFT